MDDAEEQQAEGGSVLRFLFGAGQVLMDEPFLRVPCSATKVLQLCEPSTESDGEKREYLQPRSQKYVNAPLPGQQGQCFTAGGGKRS